MSRAPKSRAPTCRRQSSKLHSWNFQRSKVHSTQIGGSSAEKECGVCPHLLCRVLSVVACHCRFHHHIVECVVFACRVEVRIVVPTGGRNESSTSRLQMMPESSALRPQMMCNSSTITHARAKRAQRSKILTMPRSMNAKHSERLTTATKHGGNNIPPTLTQQANCPPQRYFSTNQLLPRRYDSWHC